MMVSQRFPAHSTASWLVRRVSACRALPSPRRGTARRSPTSLAASNLVDANDQPYLNKTFTDGDLALVSDAVLAACDASTARRTAWCRASRPARRDAWSRSWRRSRARGGSRDVRDAGAGGGAQEGVQRRANVKGESVYAAWALGLRHGGKIGDAYNQGWRIWKIGAVWSAGERRDQPDAGRERAALDLRDAAGSPCRRLRRSRGVHAGVRCQTLPRRRLTNTVRTSSPIGPGVHEGRLDRRVEGVKARGGKLVIAQGVSDPVFSILDTVEWWNRVNKAECVGVRPSSCGCSRCPA